jgi:ribosomal protein RSM22 (predicted rRNA methylase)
VAVRGRGSRIHHGLTGARELVGTRYLADPALRREYADEIAPRTGAALAKILAELYRADAPAPARVLDLGAGTGAVGQALRAFFAARGALDVVAVDRVAGPGILVADLARELPRVEGRFDLIVAAHLIGELFLDASDAADQRARRVLAWVRAFLDDRGAVILIEPALRETSRALLEVRDRLVAAGLHVVAPCFWTGPCPALARERDWCHDAAPAARRIDFSYLALRAVAPPPAEATLFRIVSDPLVEKGRLKIYGCGAAGRHPLVRLDRHASAANAAFGDLERGDVARVAGTEVARDGLRIEAGTSVQRRRG